jgi:hypothetical protein
MSPSAHRVSSHERSDQSLLGPSGHRLRAHMVTLPEATSDLVI